jgi:hypothetical protein
MRRDKEVHDKNSKHYYGTVPYKVPRGFPIKLQKNHAEKKILKIFKSAFLKRTQSTPRNKNKNSSILLDRNCLDHDRAKSSK